MTIPSEERIFSSGSEEEKEEGVDVHSGDDDDSSYSDPLMVDPATTCSTSPGETTRRVSFSVNEDEDLPSKKKLNVVSASSSRGGGTIATLLRRWLDFYIRFLQASPAHQDRLLSVLQWTSGLAASVILGHYQSRSNNSKTVASCLQKFSSDISFARYATRLLEFPAALKAILTGCWALQAKGSSSNNNLQRLYTWLGRFLSWSMVGYYPVEASAYFLWMLPPSMQTPHRSQRAAKLSAWSCRCWFIYLVADSVQSIVRRRELLRDNADGGGDNEAALRSLRLQSIRSALFMLPCIHWALPNWDTKPWLPPNLVNGLMCAEAMVNLYQTSLALPSAAAATQPVDDAENSDENQKKKEE